MKNPVMPYLIIAVIGILLVGAISYIGISQRDAIQNDDNNSGEQAENNEGGETADAEAIFQQNCASCHGEDLSGGAGPDLTKVGSDHSADEINDIITNGTDGGMPAGLIDGKEKEAVVGWLADMI